MDIISSVSFLIAIIVIIITVMFLIADIHNFLKQKKHRGEPYYMLNLLKYLVYVEIELLALDCAVIFMLSIIRSFDMDFWLDILINVACSIGVSIVATLIAYFKFLKHIPEETKSQIDKLLNDRLNYESTNHSAVMQKGDSVQKALSDEHKEIRNNIDRTKEKIYTASREIAVLSTKLDNEKELKRLRYENLNDNSKSIIQNINKISSLGELLQEVNYENSKLKAENYNLKNDNQNLTQENENLKQKLSHYQSRTYTNDSTQEMSLD